MAQMTLKQLREDLPITRGVAYFQTGSHGPTPDSVLQTVADAMASEARSGHSDPAVRNELAAQEQAARSDLAALLNVAPEELAITTNTSWAMQQVMRSIRWQEGDEFIISSLEHVSTFGVCQELRDHHGVRPIVIEADRGDAVLLEALKSSINDRTKMVCLSEIASPDGRKLPIADACEMAHEGGVPVVVDGAQSVGQYPVDIAALGCDFYVGSGHKWLLGPMGTGFVWISPQEIESFRPNFIPDYHPWSFPDAPKQPRVEIGTANHALVIGLGRAVNIFSEIGLSTVDDHVRGLSRTLREELAKLDRVNVLTPTEPGHSAGITSLMVDGFVDADMQQLVGTLYDKHGVLVKFQWMTAPPDRAKVAMRISIAGFNSAEEVARLISGIKEELPGLPGPTGLKDPRDRTSGKNLF
jgi:selenocysteine lyase/cysteine desulfurase